MSARKIRYVEIAETFLDPDIYFGVSGRNQGQIVEVAESDGDTSPHEAGRYPAFRRVTDRSLPVDDPNRAKFYRRVGATRRGRGGLWRATFSARGSSS